MPEDLKIDRRTLLKTAVSANSVSSAFDKYLLPGKCGYVPKAEVKVAEAAKLIAGAGGAGLAAAVMAGSISKDVVVLEKTQDVGGNTRLADAFNAVDPAVQKPLGIEDSPELHARQMLETGRWCADPKLVETVATGAPRALAWLKELGVRFEPGVYQVYGSLWPRTHSPSEPEGSGYIRPLLFKCRELGVSIRTGTKVLRVIRSLAERRMTMIVVTHELQFAHDVSDQVIFLERGVVAESGTPDELFLHPKNDRTRQFLAAYVK